MSSFFTTDNENNTAQIACRVAYMIDNDQPVLCTLIGDQPLFYADEVELDHEEEDFLEDDSTSDLLFRLTHADLQEKALKLKEQRQAFVDENRIDLMEAFESNYASLRSFAEENTIKRLETLIKQSRLGEALLAFAKDQGVEIISSSEISETIYDRESAKIMVPPSLEEGTALLGLAQELRRVWQHKKGVLINPVTFAPDDAIIVNRAQIADLCIIKIRIAWEISLNGNKSAWKAVASSGLHDIAHAFLRETRHDFRKLNNGAGMQIAFEKWFLSDRCKLEDKRLIQTMLADHGGHVFESQDISRAVSVDIVTRIGEMPFGKNYLSGFAGNVIADPLYTEVRDRSSANFLWFIKFESSFRDSERALKEEQNSDITKPHIRTTLFGDLEEEEYHEKTGDSAIIAFPGDMRAKRDGANTSVRKAIRGHNVIRLFGSE